MQVCLKKEETYTITIKLNTTQSSSSFSTTDSKALWRKGIAEEKARTLGKREGKTVSTEWKMGWKHQILLWSSLVLVAVFKKATCSRRLQPRHAWCAEYKGPMAHYTTSSTNSNLSVNWAVPSATEHTHRLYGLTNIRWKVFFLFICPFLIQFKQNLYINLGFHSILLLNFLRRNGSKQYKIIMTNNCTLNMIINFKGQRHLNAL